LQVAEDVDADLIVVGSRGLGRGTRFLRGSVSTRVAGHAKTSFLVIHDNDEVTGS
jgi:nucleotide-binding universal stress UspA family protein